ncbi:MAG: oligosaccharide flippase family protein, partial [Planctomycetaceae bacterium]
TIFGFGAGQVLKLVSNLILTRLLMPEVFGFISLSYALLEGLAMFSAMGEGPAILRDKRGDDPDFVNTAWTVQVLRGNYLWLAACALAWPMARLYDESLLLRLVPVIGLTCVLEGFYSSSILTAKRHMRLGRLTAMTLIAQVAGIVTTISCAYIFRSVWALVGGALVEVSATLILSHTFLRGISSRFRWEKAALRTLFELGKWIFLSSMLEFIARQTDRLLLGYYVDMATLGIYAMAFNLSEPFARLNMQMARNVIMPALSRTHRDAPARMAEVFYKARVGVDAMHLPALGFVAATGPQIVDLLYDDRYLAAGWMLQVLCLRTAVRCLFEPSSAVCVASGTPKFVTLSRFVRALMIVIAIPIGWWYGGLHGVVWSTVVAEIPVLFVLWFGQGRLGVFNPVREMLAFALMLAGWMAGVWTVWIGTFDLFQRLVQILKGV